MRICWFYFGLFNADFNKNAAYMPLSYMYANDSFALSKCGVIYCFFDKLAGRPLLWSEKLADTGFVIVEWSDSQILVEEPKKIKAMCYLMSVCV